MNSRQHKNSRRALDNTLKLCRNLSAMKASVYLLVLFQFVCRCWSEIGFIFTPKDQAIVFGQDVLLDCSAVNLTTGGKESITLHWKHNGNPRDRKTSIFSNGTLWIPDVTENDVGNYTCVVFDESESPILESPPASVFHAYIRMFEVSPTSVFALEDDTVSFDCITGESAPPAEIFWEKDGKPFYGGSQFNASYGGHNFNSLIRQYSMKLILKAKPYLDGTYNCVAKNPVLLIEVRSLKVLLTTAEFESAPYIMDELVQAAIITPIDQSLMIDCPITGKPEVTITWYKSGVLIDGDPDFFVLQNGSLHSPKAQQKDQGSYFCEGKNSLGLARSPNISITIARLELEFIQEPEDLYVVAGLPTMLECNPPISVPIATVVWYKDDKLLVPRTGRRSVRVVKTDKGSWDLVFAEIQKMDEGEYFCVAENQHSVPQSRTSRIATVIVGGAPIFVEPPVGLTVQMGKLAKLSCFVQGDPFPDVFWYFEKDLLVVTETVSFRQSNQELWIGDMNKAREGTYTCTATNRYGSIETSVYVKVLVPPVIVTPVGHNIVSLGESAILPCGIYSDPSPTVTWYKDTNLLVIGGRFSQLTDGLFITSVEVGDAGVYLCRATNIAGTVESEGSLETQVLPHFTKEPEDQVVTIGKNLSLSCSATGYPQPGITWYYNDSALFPPETLLSLNREHLFLYNVDWKHVGEYTCHAENTEGIAISSATIKLQIPPKVSQIDGVPLLYEGEDLILACQVTGTPFPAIEWQFNRQRIEDSPDGRIRVIDQKMLSVKFVTNADEGIYSCAAYNQAGVSKRDLSVYVLSRPSLPVLLTAETTSATSVRLSWSIDQKIPQTPVNQVIVYYRKKLEPDIRLSKQEVDASQLETEVSRLDPATDYIFMVAAENDAGISDVSNILAARTYDAGPSQPRNVGTTNIQSNQFTATWEIPEVMNGEIRKYRIRFREMNSLEETLIIISSNGSASQDYTIKDLKPYTWYSFEIQAATMEGDQVLWGNVSDVVEVKTAESAPVGPPQEVRAKALTFDTIQVTWEAVPQEQQNGPIKRYYIKYWLLSNMTIPLGEISSESLNFNINITDLDPYSWYMVKVTSENDGGIGAESDPVLVQTLPTVPSAPPTNITVSPSSHSLILVWEPPPMSTWNSELTGYQIQYWEPSDEKNVTTFFVYGLDNSATIGNLEPYTVYRINVAAFTTQVQDGVGPLSDNITVRTADYKPGIIRELAFTPSQTDIRLSWKQPAVTNGIIREYLVTYQLIGPATPSANQNLVSAYAMNIFNDSTKMGEVFQSFPDEVIYEEFYSLTELCDIILTNETAAAILNKTDDQSEAALQNLNATQAFINWLIDGVNYSVVKICETLANFVKRIIIEEKKKMVPNSMFNISVTGRQAVLTDLEPDHIYNLSVTAGTGAGYGEPVTVQTSTLKNPPTQQPTQPPRQTTTEPVGQPPVLEQTANRSDMNLPVIIGGGVSGFVLIMIIILVIGCLFLRRQRGNLDEKVHVIKQEATEDAFSNKMYGELERPKLPATMASAAEDGTDSVEVYGNRVKYRSPARSSDEQSESSSSFMTESSRHNPASGGHQGEESFLGMGNTSYSGIGSRPGIIKSNPAYYEDPYSSGHETMSVTMAFSSEDMLSQQGESTLKRKHRMRGADAAAIAHLRNSAISPEMAESDTSSLIHNEVEIVYNERTAL